MFYESEKIINYNILKFVDNTGFEEAEASHPHKLHQFLI